jgi:hypothetical protein
VTGRARALIALGGLALTGIAAWLLRSPGELEASAQASPAVAAGVVPVARERVCSTLGEPKPLSGGAWRVDAPKLRATIAGSSGRALSLTFRLLGETAEQAPLGSGELRQQLGLELAARDQCNLLYVMWRQLPRPELVVQVKRNAGDSTHAECENGGYHRLRPTRSASLPVLVPGKAYTLGARIEQRRLEVAIDGASVWQGPLDGAALELSGRAGLRSDNLRFEVQALSAELVAGAPATCPGSG